MVQIYHYDILLAIAERIVSELYAVAKDDCYCMVCDWRAYAVLEAYKQYAYLIEDIAIPSIEQCFDGAATPCELAENADWKALSEMHLIHWGQYLSADDEAVYGDYLNQTTLRLEHYTLAL